MQRLQFILVLIVTERQLLALSYRPIFRSRVAGLPVVCDDCPDWLNCFEKRQLSWRWLQTNKHNPYMLLWYCNINSIYSIIVCSILIRCPCLAICLVLSSYIYWCPGSKQQKQTGLTKFKLSWKNFIYFQPTTLISWSSWSLSMSNFQNHVC